MPFPTSTEKQRNTSMIHYHGTPMTPVADMIRAFACRHAMVSYENPEQIEVCAEICQSVTLDNGAFSAWKASRPHDFQGYSNWCLSWMHHPAVDWCIIPDVIDGNETENDDLIARWTLPPWFSVPVYHMHESLERLTSLMTGHYPRVAIGSSGVFANIGDRKWWRRMAEIMNVACINGHPRRKLHGLRMLDPGIFSRLPLASADSTNVARNVGLDQRWKGTYVPQSRAMRALILMDRIERHASASAWSTDVIADYHNMELFG
jgi:hypothetical protein